MMRRWRRDLPDVFDPWTDVERLIDDFKEGLSSLLRPLRYQKIRESEHPIDVADLGDRYEVQVEIPGVPKEDIDIEVTPRGFEVRVEHKEEEEERGKSWIRKERSEMSFSRKIELPEEIKPEEVKAKLRDGILTITLPKAKPVKKEKARKVKID